VEIKESFYIKGKSFIENWFE